MWCGVAWVRVGWGGCGVGWGGAVMGRAWDGAGDGVKRARAGMPQPHHPLPGQGSSPADHVLPGQGTPSNTSIARRRRSTINHSSTWTMKFRSEWSLILVPEKAYALSRLQKGYGKSQRSRYQAGWMSFLRSGECCHLGCDLRLSAKSAHSVKFSGNVTPASQQPEQPTIHD